MRGDRERRGGVEREGWMAGWREREWDRGVDEDRGQ